MKLDTLPLASSGNWDPIIDAIKRGDYFWTSGEVLISNYAVQGAGAKRTIVADLEWTFPLEFVEVVWGDGVKIDRQIISGDRPGAVRAQALRDSVRRHRQEVGALRGVGHGRQRRDGPAGQADHGGDVDAVEKPNFSFSLLCSCSGSVLGAIIPNSR